MSSRITLVIADDELADAIVTQLQAGHQAVIWPIEVVTVSLEPVPSGADYAHHAGHCWCGDIHANDDAAELCNRIPAAGPIDHKPGGHVWGPGQLCT